MPETDNNIAIVLLTRNRLEIFDMNQKKVFPFNLPPTIFQDLEIINKSELETQMSLFVNFYKIRPVPVLIILGSDVCFELEISETNDSLLENRINNFLNYLPFEESIHKVYKLAKGYYVSAVNKEITEVLKSVFKKLGFFIEAIVPSSIAGINVKTIDAPAADFLLAKINVIKSQSIIAPETHIHENKTEEKKVMGVNRIFLLLGVFLMLLVILLLVLYQQTVNNNKKSAFNISIQNVRIIS